MKKLNTYENLCADVYELSKPNAPKEDYEFYRSYAQEADGLILEPMCGTGRFLLPMLEEGFEVHGFDASQSMLERLYAKAKASQLKPTVWHGFFEDLNSKNKYKLVFIPAGSFGLITQWIDVKNALRIIYDHLDDEGVLVFEVETHKALPKDLNLWRGSRWHRQDGKDILLSQLALFEDPICYSIAKYELVEANRVIHTEVEEYKIRLYSDTSLLLNLLAEIGFSNVRLVKAFDRGASPNDDEACIIYECRK